MKKTCYTKYAEIYNDNAFLCGPMPVPARVAWQDAHNVESDYVCPNIIVEEDNDSYFVFVYSNMRGWRWNHKMIIKYFDSIYDGNYDVEFFLYHEPELREIMGDKHFKDLLHELKIYKEFKEQKKNYERPGVIKRIIEIHPIQEAI